MNSDTLDRRYEQFCLYLTQSSSFSILHQQLKSKSCMSISFWVHIFHSILFPFLLSFRVVWPGPMQQILFMLHRPKVFMCCSVMVNWEEDIRHHSEQISRSCKRRKRQCARLSSHYCLIKDNQSLTTILTNPCQIINMQLTDAEEHSRNTQMISRKSSADFICWIWKFCLILWRNISSTIAFLWKQTLMMQKFQLIRKENKVAQRSAFTDLYFVYIATKSIWQLH